MAAMTVDVHKLMLSCIRLGYGASSLIRRIVREGGDLQVKSKDGDAFDPQTIADVSAQQLIIGSLRREWPALQIIGAPRQRRREPAVPAPRPPRPPTRASPFMGAQARRGSSRGTPAWRWAQNCSWMRCTRPLRTPPSSAAPRWRT